MSFLQNILDSFKNTPQGFSARKLSAFAAVTAALWITINHATDSNVAELIMIWLLFSLLCLSIITVEQLVVLRTGWSSTKTTETKKVETGSGKDKATTQKQTTETTTEKKNVTPQTPAIPPPDEFQEGV